MDAIVHFETSRRSTEHRQQLAESLYALPGVAAVRADPSATMTSVLFDDEVVDMGEIADEVRECGFSTRSITFRRLQ